MHIAWFNGDTYVGEKAMDYGLTGTTNDWVRLTLTADIPSGANRAGVYLDLKDATGTVWFDGVQLETGASANRYNLLNDADIDSGTSYWKYYIPGYPPPSTTAWWKSTARTTPTAMCTRRCR